MQTWRGCAGRAGKQKGDMMCCVVMQCALGAPGVASGLLRAVLRELPMPLGKLGLQASRRMVMVTAAISVSSKRGLWFLSL